jgi:hypothetical protein
MSSSHHHPSADQEAEWEVFEEKTEAVHNAIVANIKRHGMSAEDAHTLSGDDILRTVKERDEIGQGGSVSGRSVRRAGADMSVVESFQMEN